MKKISIFLVVATMLAVLTGCGTKATETVDPNAIVMDDVTKMMAGTLLLQTTDYPLDAEQESSLLMLWKGYNVVATSSTSADAEIKALQEQIKAVFTKDQLSAIEDMELTADNVTTKLSDIGIQMGGTSAEGTDTPSDMMQMPMGGGEMPGGQQGGGNQNQSGSSNRSGGGMPSGGMPGGGMPSGGMMGGGMMGGGQSSLTGETGSSSTISQQATLMANSLSSLSSRTTNTMLLTLVIQYLQSEVNPGSGMPGGMPGGNMPGGTMPTGEPGTMPGNMPTGEAGNMPGNMPGGMPSGMPGNQSTPEATEAIEATATPTP